MKKLTAEQRLELVHVSLMRDKNYQGFVGLFMVGKTSVDDKVRTARTNGRDATYGRAFVDELTDRELAFLVMHENMHKCYRHLTTWKGLHDIDHNLANAACDYVINIQLTDMDPNESLLAMPRDKKTGEILGLRDERFRGMDTKQVFDILRKEQRGKKGQGNGKGTGPGTNDSDVDDSSGLDEHDWDDASEMDAESKKQLEQDIEQALRQGGVFAGKMGGKMPREISELLKPQVNWRDILKAFVKVHLRDRDSPSWRKAHRNYLWQDVILPSIVGKRMKHLVVGFDTSGSVQGALLDAFMGEMLKAIKDGNPHRVDIIYWDAEVAGHETYKGSEMQGIAQRTSPAGGGGTDPDCVVAFMRERKLKPDALVMLSDGYMHSDSGVWAGVGCPVLWCIIGSDSFKPPCGQLVNVKE